MLELERFLFGWLLLSPPGHIPLVIMIFTLLGKLCFVSKELFPL